MWVQHPMNSRSGFVGYVNKNDHVRIRRAFQFNRVEHLMSDFEFIAIEKVVNESKDHIDGRLLTREASWCSQLCTLNPHGLNKRSEFNSKNRIRFSQ